MADNIVIVGAGHAAAEAVTALRKKGWQGSVTLIGDEPILPYQRPPLSKAYFKGDVVAEKLLIKGEVVYANAQVDLKLGCRVVEIDRPSMSVLLSNGERISYAKLILATGTRVRKLNVEGANLNKINYLRTLSDVDAIKAQLPTGGRLLIVGAGYIGLEVAASAVQHGIKVTVLEAADRVLARVTSPIMSDFFLRKHAENGVDIRLNSQLVKFEELPLGGDALRAVMSNGDEYEFDCAVIGVGVLPNSELAEQADLACDNGVCVNEYAQTSDPDIYAVGDCSNYFSFLYQRNIRLESVPNAIEQAKVAVVSMLGHPIAYDSVPWFWSDQYDIKLQTVGLLNEYDDVVVRGDIQSNKFSAFYLKAGRLIAMDAINSPADFMLSKKLIEAKVHPEKSLLADSSLALKSLLT